MAKDQYTDKTLNRFQKTNLYYATDPFLLYQDPTYLGFKLLFEFDQPTSGLLSRNTHINTAMGYLNSIGDQYRVTYLSKFVDILEGVNKKTPWFFQTIEGLPDVWKRGYQEADFKPILPKDRKITIGCEESIDLRVSTMMDLYRKATFDWNFRREVIPWNLRTFKVWIYVYEARNINVTGQPNSPGLIDISKILGLQDINKKQQTENKRLLGIQDNEEGSSLIDRVTSLGDSVVSGIKDLKDPPVPDNIDVIDTKQSHFLFKLDMCEFLPDESGEFLGKVSNITGERATQKIAFTYRNVEEVNLNNIYSGDVAIRDAVIGQLNISAFDIPYAAQSNQKGGWSLDSVLNDSGFGVLSPFATMAADKIESLVSSYAGKLFMGNIFGFSANNLLGNVTGALSGDPTSIVAAAQGAARQLGNINGKRNDSTKISGDDKYYDEGTPSQGNTSTKISGDDKYYDNVTPNESNKISNDTKYATRPGSNSFSNKTKDSNDIGNTFE